MKDLKTKAEESIHFVLTGGLRKNFFLFFDVDFLKKNNLVDL
jgi:hypothetical protein